MAAVRTGRRRNFTAELLKAVRQGRRIMASGMPIYRNSRSGEWPVEYMPRSKNDPKPWVPVGTDYHLGGRECHVEKRYIVIPVGLGYFLVRDMIAGVDESRWNNEEKAYLYARQLNQADLQEMGLDIAL